MSNDTVFLRHQLQEHTQTKHSTLDFLGSGTLTERVVSLALGEIPPGGQTAGSELRQLADCLRNYDVSDLNVVVLGGGTGLSNIVGGDSRRPEWKDTPFTGLKEVFPCLHSIVCVTDDGGSTGELLKDFPLIALGDLRHVLLAAIEKKRLQKIYHLDDNRVVQVAAILHTLFNYRFISHPVSPARLIADSTADVPGLPAPLNDAISSLLERLFFDERMAAALDRPQCLGNLLLASAIYEQLPADLSSDELSSRPALIHRATLDGLAALARVLGAGENSVLPCTTTSARLQMMYANGVVVTSECKSGAAQRGYPVDRVMVEFQDEPQVPCCIPDLLKNADIIIMAPGSLYSSIIPILQVPGLSELIRENTKALKLLIANIWVQKGETDATRDVPERKFHVSDLIKAYEHNISGGIQNLFTHVLSLDLADIPGSVLQNYALEDKEPIYLDRRRVRRLGFEPVCAYIFSRDLLQNRHVIQHDPDSLALVLKVLTGLRASGFLSSSKERDKLPFALRFSAFVNADKQHPCIRYARIFYKLNALDFSCISSESDEMHAMEAERRKHIRDCIGEIIWRHPDIIMDHIQFVRGVCLVDIHSWKRSQIWDNVFSFFDPADGFIKIRSDQTENLQRFEMVFLVGLGQSLLGNYAEKKWMEDVSFKGDNVGRVFCLQMRKAAELECFLSLSDLDTYIQLCRMYSSAKCERLYTRLVNGEEGFTPPGLLFGLCYAWYLDNRFAPNIEYKMSIMKNEPSYLIPEQVRLASRREQLVRFFRETVFRRILPEIKLSG
ncbi:MAG: YvcK family protein [Desulfobulbus sp.]|nr:MAG: YvcK family protein [Desulfobulbus sp.]